MKILLFITSAIIVIFALFPDIDLVVSSLFYDSSNGGFYLNNNIVLVFFYYFIYFLTAFLLLGLSAIIGAKIIDKKLDGRISLIRKISNIISAKDAVFLLIALILGPGLIVHNVFKPLWERARPLNIVEFGGDKSYSPPLYLGHQEDEKSFVSGHSAMGFYMVSFALLLQGKKRRNLYIAGLSFGTLIALFRVMQGAHFLSDVVFGALISLIVAHVTHKILYRNLR